MCLNCVIILLVDVLIFMVEIENYVLKIYRVVNVFWFVSIGVDEGCLE